LPRFPIHETVSFVTHAHIILIKAEIQIVISTLKA